MQLTTKPIRTKYWRPGDDFLKIILECAVSECEDGDFVVLSEKAISVSLGRVVDEKDMKPNCLAKILARVWMRLIWGRIIGPLCHLNRRTLRRLREYPSPFGEHHKQTALRYAGIWQALLHYSEGGIDVTNLPFSLASLPLRDAKEVAEKVRELITAESLRNVSVMIVDTDKTYSRNGTYVTPRAYVIRGIQSFGILAFIIGRSLRWTAQATPLAVSGQELSVSEALSLADAADKSRGYGAGRTVWDMARRFHVGLADITWDMLDRVDHYPIVIVKRTA